MLNPLNFITKFIKSSNQKELDRIKKIVVKVNSLEATIKNLSDEDFPKKTIELKDKLNKGENIDNLLPEAFAKASGNRLSIFSPLLSLSFNSIVFLGKSSSLRFLIVASKELTFTTIFLILSSSF